MCGGENLRSCLCITKSPPSVSFFLFLFLRAGSQEFVQGTGIHQLSECERYSDSHLFWRMVVRETGILANEEFMPSHRMRRSRVANVFFFLVETIFFSRSFFLFKHHISEGLSSGSMKCDIKMFWKVKLPASPPRSFIYGARNPLLEAIALNG